MLLIHLMPNFNEFVTLNLVLIKLKVRGGFQTEMKMGSLKISIINPIPLNILR